MGQNSKKEKAAKKSGQHDLFFKDGYSAPRFAKELFQLALTKKEFAAFDWDSLTPEKDTFQDIRADLVFSVALKGDPSGQVKICLLLEHKSQYNRKVYYQTLKYKTAVIGKSLTEAGEAVPVFSVVLHHGPKPWPGETSLKKGLWGGILSKIPPSLAKDMLDCGLRIVDTYDPRVKRAVKNSRIKSRGYLNLLKRAWSLKPDVEELKKALFLFDNWPGDRDDLILSVGSYLWAVVPGMTEELWLELERSAVKKGIFTKGGYMNTREYIKEEGRQKGMQQGIRQGMQQGIEEGKRNREREMILNMLKKKLDTSFISEVTGLSEEKIKKIQNGK